MGSLTKLEIPYIDFSKDGALVPGTDSWALIRDQTVRALEEFGCFVANYSRVSSDLHNDIFQASKQLFDLPRETRMKNTSTTPSHGYVGQVPLIPLYEGLGIEDSTLLEAAQDFTRLMWPDGNQFFCEKAHSFATIVAELEQTVTRMVAESYEIEGDNETDEMLSAKSYLLRFIKYIARLDPETTEPTVGFLPHTDKSHMSILHQSNVKGLELKLKGTEEWILLEPSPTSFIVMAGEACTAWTNGRIDAPYHRVVMNGKEDRYSMGLFTHIRGVLVKAPEKLVDESHPLLFHPFDHYKLINYLFTDEGKKSKSAIKSFCGV
ncbi:probable 2-oxoglutarate-dependent dioxygenase AOP1 [Impatiens glandulifera]|uniref:probable 2-oxoglutarate-dependent dioxygenase AOP1 n=1 Tax=Impatiens glandulifera TaxID=253017 RepID=UPI001FB0D296|nr:probable 2-oxoglutarate-dependent dioxygenase AOP1 [Impatiens glandulifera]